MDFEQYIIPENLDNYNEDKPLQSIYLEFMRKNVAEILARGEFEALRRWICSTNVVMPVPVRPAESHRITREFYKALKREQKGK